MENKRGFILYPDQKGIFNKLPDDKAGKLIKHIFSYVSDENPDTDDLIIDVAFESIKQQLKRDLEKRKSEIQKRSDAGKKGMETRWGKGKTNNNTVITKDKSVIPAITNITDNVTVTVTDTVNVKIYNKLQNENLNDFLTPTELDNFIAYRSEPIQKGKYAGKERWEGQKTWDTKKRMTTWNKNKETDFGKDIKPTNDKEWIGLFDTIKKSGGSILKYKDQLGDKEYVRLYKLRHKEKVMDVLLNN